MGPINLHALIAQCSNTCIKYDMLPSGLSLWSGLMLCKGRPSHMFIVCMSWVRESGCGSSPVDICSNCTFMYTEDQPMRQNSNRSSVWSVVMQNFCPILPQFSFHCTSCCIKIWSGNGSQSRKQHLRKSKSSWNHLSYWFTSIVSYLLFWHLMHPHMEWVPSYHRLGGGSKRLLVSTSSGHIWTQTLKRKWKRAKLVSLHARIQHLSHSTHGSGYGDPCRGSMQTMRVCLWDKCSCSWCTLIPSGWMFVLSLQQPHNPWPRIWRKRSPHWGCHSVRIQDAVTGVELRCSISLIVSGGRGTCVIQDRSDKRLSALALACAGPTLYWMRYW